MAISLLKFYFVRHTSLRSSKFDRVVGSYLRFLSKTDRKRKMRHI